MHYICDSPRGLSIYLICVINIRFDINPSGCCYLWALTPLIHLNTGFFSYICIDVFTLTDAQTVERRINIHLPNQRLLNWKQTCRNETGNQKRRLYVSWASGLSMMTFSTNFRSNDYAQTWPYCRLRRFKRHYCYHPVTAQLSWLRTGLTASS